MNKLVIGTRGSKLALIQTDHVIAELQRFHPDLLLEKCIIKTHGDSARTAPLYLLGGKGVFVKEIEDALLTGEIDLAVHSLKDLPTETPDGLVLGAIMEREDPRDVLVCNVEMPGMDEALHSDKPWTALPESAVIGTSSMRRSAQLLHIRPDLELVNIRGNLDTRLRKLKAEKLHAIILAAAGLLRMNAVTSKCVFLPYDVSLPAPGQGALAIETRIDHEEAITAITPLDHSRTRQCVTAERAFLETIQGGCNVPVGAIAEDDSEGRMRLRGRIMSPDGRTLMEEDGTDASEQAAVLGQSVGRALLANGARRLLDEFRNVVSGPSA